LALSTDISRLDTLDRRHVRLDERRRGERGRHPSAPPAQSDNAESEEHEHDDPADSEREALGAGVAGAIDQGPDPGDSRLRGIGVDAADGLDRNRVIGERRPDQPELLDRVARGMFECDGICDIGRELDLTVGQGRRRVEVCLGLCTEDRGLDRAA
jgi:hypothetical protein